VRLSLLAIVTITVVVSFSFSLHITNIDDSVQTFFHIVDRPGSSMANITSPPPAGQQTTPSVLATGNITVADAQTEEGFAKFQAQSDMKGRLGAHPTPLSLHRYCSNPRHKLSSANYLVSAVADERTMTRMSFGRARRGRYNPKTQPFPKDYNYPCIGFARQSPKQKVLECVQPAQKLNLEEWTSNPGSCTSIPFLSLKLGHSDPRIMFSPLGEPLMVVGNNGKANCMGQFVIDLRAVIPGLSTKMKLDHVPNR
jgi:hypothetical protein